MSDEIYVFSLLVSKQIKSMTGFGKSRWEGDQATISCEIKALNGRYFEADIRLPRYLAEMDALIRKKLGEVLERGTVSVTYNIRWEDTRPPIIWILAPLVPLYLRCRSHLEPE